MNVKQMKALLLDQNKQIKKLASQMKSLMIAVKGSRNRRLRKIIRQAYPGEHPAMIPEGAPAAAELADQQGDLHMEEQIKGKSPLVAPTFNDWPGEWLDALDLQEGRAERIVRGDQRARRESKRGQQ